MPRAAGAWNDPVTPHRAAFRTLLCLLALTGAACSADSGGSLLDGGSLACSSDEMCAADRACREGRCVIGPRDACRGPDDCPAGQVCTRPEGCDGGGCAAACVVAPCAADPDCGEGRLCLEGVCGEAPACGLAMPCPAGLECVDGTCGRPRPCATSDECSEGEACIGGFCGVPARCGSTSDCKDDLRCIGGLCQPGCTRDEDCGQPPLVRCEVATGECRMRCFQDDQ